MHKTELVLIATITLAGIALRVWQPSHMAVEHFDEGVYASNLYSPASGNAYPFRHLYAPPLLPAVLEWALILSGGQPSAVMWMNVVAGCMLVPSLWWVGRAWHGPLAGLTAAGLAAVSPLHIQYSRAALTDGLLCLWMLWGVYWAWRAILTGRPAAIALAGLFASLAWWTKYNGWLTLAISAAGTAAWLIAPRIIPARLAAHFKCAANRPPGEVGSAPSVKAAILRWDLIVVIAALGWLPVLIDLQDVGGYAAVSANHAKYFVGIEGWPNSLARQADNLAHYYSILSLAAALLVVIGLALTMPWVRPSSSDKQTDCDARKLAGWMLAAWFLGLFVAVPLYSPYPRLTLAWVVAVWLVAGAMAHWLSRRMAPQTKPRGIPITRWGPALFLIVAAALTQGAANQRLHLTADRRGLQNIAGEILTRIEQEIPADGGDRTIVVFVLGEPGLYFHLGADAQHRPRISEHFGVLAAADYESVTGQTTGSASIFLVTGPHASPLDKEPTEVRRLLREIGEWNYFPSDLVLLDEHPPGILANRETQPAEPVRLYQVTR